MCHLREIIGRILLLVSFTILQTCTSDSENVKVNSTEWPDDSENFSCSTFDTFAKSYIKCNFSHGNTTEFDRRCINGRKNHTIGISIATISPAVTESLKLANTLRCASNTPMSIQVEFLDGVELTAFTNMRQEKSFQNYSNKSTYEYTLFILLPTVEVILLFTKNIVVKYKIKSVIQGELQANIVLHLGPDLEFVGFKLFQNPVIEISNQEFVQIDVVNLHRTNFTLEKSICRKMDDGRSGGIEDGRPILCLEIPNGAVKFTDSGGLVHEHFTLATFFTALNFKHEQLIILEDENAPLDQIRKVLKTVQNTSERPIIVNNHVIGAVSLERFIRTLKNTSNSSCKQNSVSYDQLKYMLQLLDVPESVLGDDESLSFEPLLGFTVHNKLFQMYGPGEYEIWSTDSKIINFTIRFRDFTVSPLASAKLLQFPQYNILKRELENYLVFNCSSSENFTMESSLQSKLQITNHMSPKLFQKFQSSAVIDSSHLKIDISIKVTCSTQNEIIERQLIEYAPNVWSMEFSYSKENNFFTCAGENEVILRQWKCKTYFQCQIVAARCLDRYTVVGQDGDRKYREQYCMNSIIDAHSQICSDVEEAGKAGSFVNCFVLYPSEKGLVQCYTPGEKSSDPKSILYMESHSMYFRGFDDILYIEQEMQKPPPRNATLKLSSLGSLEIYYVNGEYQFKCQAHSFFFDDGLQWFLKFKNGTDFRVISTEFSGDFHVTKQHSTDSVVIMKLLIKDVAINQIICSAPVLGSDGWENETLDLIILESIPPKIYSLEDEVQLVEGKLNEVVTCQSNGRPQPQITWRSLKSNIEHPVRVVDRNTLLFPIYNSSYSGEYECTASNIAGNVTKRIKIIGRRDNYYYTLTVIAVSISIFIFILLMFLYYIVNKKMKKYHEMKGIVNLLNGNKTSTTNADHSSVDPLELPFDEKYEISKNTFIIDRNHLLGKGEFGEVYKGLLDGVERTVAFKTVRPNYGTAPLKALVSELKVMMYIGPHENLVTLFGAYKREISNGILYVAIEFCELGSLESFLRKSKSEFLENIGLNTNHEYLNSQSFLSVNNANPCPYSIHILLKWSLQISKAMEYLGTKKVVHSDLATRNVLLTSKRDAKVTDFGLSRRTYNYTEYIKTAKDPLPWRWLALESLKTNTFSSQSDVWSYGVTLWEMFSLGDIPYPGMAPSAEFVQELENGLRNFKPKYATDEIYDLMVRCWHTNPEKRPTFCQMRIVLGFAVCNGETNIYIHPGSNFESALELAMMTNYTII